MKDQYEQLCAMIRSRGVVPKSKRLKYAVPPPIPNEKRITQVDIDAIASQRNQEIGK